MSSMKDFVIFCVVLLCAAVYHVYEVHSANCASYSTETDCSGVTGCWWVDTSSLCECSSNVTMDICFAIDSSWSVDEPDFQIGLDWLADFVESSLSNEARIGIIEFALYSFMLMNFTDSPSYTSDELSTFITTIGYTGNDGYGTNTVQAIKQALEMYETYSDDQRSKVYIILTDGRPWMPNSGDVDVCAWASDLKSDDITTIIVGIGDRWTSEKVDCLVDDVDNDIIYISNFSYSQFDTILPTITEITCPVSYDIVITEVKVISDDSNDMTVPFIEFYNPSSDITLSDLTFSGVVSGTITQDIIIPQGYYFVIYDGSYSIGQNVTCSQCDCNLMSNGIYCTNAIYYGCINVDCTFLSQYDNTNWYLTIEDNGDDSNIDTVTYDTSTWPSIVDGFSYELKSKGYDNDEGNNWQGSCNKYGTPGSEPITDCTEVCTTDQCTANGATDTSYSGSDCTCSDTNYYSDGCSCNLVPPPGDCYAYWLKNDTSNARTVKFLWSRASTDSDHYYQLSYWTSSGSIDSFQTYSRDKTVSDYQYTRGSEKIAGYVQTVIEYGTGRSALSTEINCTSITQAPTPAPTDSPSLSPTPAPSVSPTPSPTFENPYLFLGGDLCEYERCSCNGFSNDCVGDDLYKEFAENNDQSQLITIEQRPTDFPYTTKVFWSISYVGATTSNDTQNVNTNSATNRRRLAMQRILSDNIGKNIDLNDISFLANTNNQGSGSLFSSTELPSTTNIMSNDIEPTSGFVNVSIAYSNPSDTSSISGNNGKISFIILEENENVDTDDEFELFYLKLENCSVDSTFYEECSILYPSSLYMIIENSNGEDSFSSTTEEEMPAWLWWVIVALVIFLFILGWLVYRYWWKNKQTNDQLNEAETDLEDAMEEADLGFGRDLGQGDVGFNPLATGVPNSSRPADAMGAELANRQQFVGNDKADVIVDKFHHKDQFGQVQPQRRGNDLTQPLL